MRAAVGHVEPEPPVELDRRVDVGRHEVELVEDRPRCVVGHAGCSSQQATSSAVVVMVATSERELSTIVSVYSCGNTCDRVPGHDHLVREVHRVEDRVRYGDVRRHAHDHDRRRPEVAQDRVDVGAGDRAEPVQPGGDDVGVGATVIGSAMSTISLPTSCGPPWRAIARNRRALWFAPSHVGAMHRHVVDDLHAGAPTGFDEAGDLVDHPRRARRLRQLRQRALRPITPRSALLRDDRGVSRRDQLDEVGHQRP